MPDYLIRGIPQPVSGQTIEIAWNQEGRMVARLTPSFDSWHEMIPLEPHGRLIDADNYNEVMATYFGDTWIDLFRHVPVVIPES